MESCSICGCTCHNSSCRGVGCSPGDKYCVGCTILIKNPTPSWKIEDFKDYKLKNIPTIKALHYKYKSEYDLPEINTFNCVDEHGHPYLVVKNRYLAYDEGTSLNYGDWVVLEGKDLRTYTDEEFRKRYEEVLSENIKN